MAAPLPPRLGAVLATAGLAVLAAGCAGGVGEDPAAVLAVVEQAAASREAGDFDAFTACFAGEKAGRYREELQTVHGGDVERFFASKRRMVVTGPVEIRRVSFAFVRVFVVHSTGYKPYDSAGVLFVDGRWLIDSFLPGDLEEPRTAQADPGAIVELLAGEAASPRPGGADGAFRHIQLLRALEVVKVRRLQDAVPSLIRLLEGDADAGIRQFAAHILGDLQDGAAAPALEGALADADLRVRGDAALSLARLGAAGAAGALERLRDDDPAAWVREQAAAALRRLAGADGG